MEPRSCVGTDAGSLQQASVHKTVAEANTGTDIILVVPHKDCTTAVVRSATYQEKGKQDLRKATEAGTPAVAAGKNETDTNSSLQANSHFGAASRLTR